MVHKQLRGVAVIAVLLLAAGCGSAGASTGNQQKYVVKLTSPAPQNDPVTDMLVAFAKNAHKDSNGRLTITVYPQGQAGSIQAAVDQARQNTVQMGLAVNAYFAPYYSDLSVANLPFLFSSPDQVTKVYAGPVGQQMGEAIRVHTGLRVLNWVNSGPCVIFFNRVRPIQSVADMKGIRLRIAPDPVAIASIQALGAVYTNVAITELYTAMQQGVTDGGVLSLPYINANKYYEVAPYLSMIYFNCSAYAVYVNNQYYSGLPSDLQRVLNNDMSKSIKSFTAQTASFEDTASKELRSKGAKINTVPKETIAAFRTAETSVYDKTKASAGPDGRKWIDELLAGA